jgi:CheY-like chemotaxis protein
MKTIAQILIEELRDFMDKPIESVDKPKRVLIVDDNHDYAMMLSEVIRDEGYEVSIADEPIEAVRSIFSTVPFTKVFLDLNFPGKESGLSALEKIRALYPTLPVVIISGFIDEEFEKIAKGYGFKVLNKGNFELEELKALLAL